MDARKVPDHRLSVSCILGKAEPIMADDGARANGATASYRHPVHHYHVVPDDRIIPNGNLSIQRAIVADADIVSQLDPGTDIRALPGGGPGLILSVKMLDGTEKRPLALAVRITLAAPSSSISGPVNTSVSAERSKCSGTFFNALTQVNEPGQ